MNPDSVEELTSFLKQHIEDIKQESKSLDFTDRIVINAHISNHQKVLRELSYAAFHASSIYKKYAKV